MRFFLMCLVICIHFSSVFAQYPYEMTINVRIVNLVRAPGVTYHDKRGPVLSRNVPQLDTQLSFGQRVLVQGECFVGQETWVRIQALEQKKAVFNPDGSFNFIAYVGWMCKKDLIESMKICEELHAKKIDESDALLQEAKQDAKNTREQIVSCARSFLGSPYVWGGCSEYNLEADYLTGVDCSGLIYLCYRKSEIEVPRDAHDQFIFTREIDPESMQPGDLIFFGVERECNSKIEIRINHVLMCIGNGLLIEAFAGNPSCSDVGELSQAEKALACIREILLEERLGKSLSDLRNGELLSKTNSFIYFRSVFPQAEC